MANRCAWCSYATASSPTRGARKNAAKAKPSTASSLSSPPPLPPLSVPTQRATSPGAGSSGSPPSCVPLSNWSRCFASPRHTRPSSWPARPSTRDRHSGPSSNERWCDYSTCCCFTRRCRHLLCTGLSCTVSCTWCCRRLRACCWTIMICPGKWQACIICPWVLASSLVCRYHTQSWMV